MTDDKAYQLARLLSGIVQFLELICERVPEMQNDPEIENFIEQLRAQVILVSNLMDGIDPRD